MDKYTATELAFKHGYEKGYEAGKPKWIPVSERLPEKHERVIVCDVREDFRDAWEFEGEGWFNGLWTLEKEEVTHWMPLPEPPKEGE